VFQFVLTINAPDFSAACRLVARASYLCYLRMQAWVCVAVGVVAFGVAAFGVATEQGLADKQSTARADAILQGEAFAVFEKFCFECHGAERQSGGLRLDLGQAALAGGDGGPAIHPASAADSPLIQRLRLPPDDPEAMPPEGEPRPSPEQIQTLVDWIEAGAGWPGAAGASLDGGATSESKPPYEFLTSPANELDFKEQVLPFLKHFCYDCHDAKRAEAHFNLQEFAENKFDDGLQSWNKRWSMVAMAVSSGTMPHPRQKRQPSLAQRQRFAEWFQLEQRSRITADTSRPTNPRLRQLTPVEYDNTLRDLTGLDLSPSRIIAPGGPAGDGGFLNQGHEMLLPPSRLARYLQAAGMIAAHAAVEPASGVTFFATPNEAAAQRLGGAPDELQRIALQKLAEFATRAFRRPLEEAEALALAELLAKELDTGATAEEACRQVVKAILAAPQFIYVAEAYRGPDGEISWSDKTRNPSKTTHPLSDYELASRLSYFLWSTMPDDALLERAAAGTLHQPEVLEAEVGRMLRDPRASALATEFAGYWLGFNKLDQHLDINRDRFPELTDSLRDAMFQEVRRFIEEVIREDLSLLTLLDADFTFVNGELAAIYGIQGVQGEAFLRVALDDRDRRGGLLGMAGILSLTSHPDRHSAVERGAFLLKRILGTPPPEPPDDVGNLEQLKLEAQGLSMRQILERHRADDRCAGCHRTIDPLGFALDGFDAIGRWRDADGGAGAATGVAAEGPIDVSTTLPDGTRLNGLASLKDYLQSNQRSRDFSAHFCEQLLTYALTRGIQAGDMYTLLTMREALEANDHRLSAAFVALVQSEVFRLSFSE